MTAHDIQLALVVALCFLACIRAWQRGDVGCRHEFRYSDLRLTGIPEPTQPGPGATQEEWRHWGDQVIGGNHPWHTERVSWRCRKCGKEFRAHCGLDVLQHGTAVRE